MHKNQLLILSILSSVLFFGLLISLEERSYNRVPSSIFSLTPYERGKLCRSALDEIIIYDKKLGPYDPLVHNQIENAFIVCLSNYIQIKTISPIGDEHLAVEFLESIFENSGIPHKSFEVKNLTEGPKTRLNFIATLSSDQKENYLWNELPEKNSIILLHHMDVVDVFPEQWEDPTLVFSGKVKNSKKDPENLFLWGRGALDMKGIGVIQLLNLFLFKKMELPLERDIHFLAVADEEQTGSGAIGTIKKMRQGEELYSLSKANLLLNEGGGGLKDTPENGFDLFLLAVEEKGGAWMDFKHTSPEELLKDLYQSKILNINDYITKRGPRFTGHNCKIVSIETPKPKVNVVTSKVSVELKCNKDFQVEHLFKNLFSSGFKTVEVEVTQNEDLVSIDINTDSSSHGSLGLNESALSALAVGLYRTKIIDFKRKKIKPRYFTYIKTEATKRLLKVLSKSKTILKVVNKLSFIPFIRNLILSEVEDSFGVDGLFKTTCQFSALNYDGEKASGLVDCRLLHSAVQDRHSQNQAEDFILTLKRKIKDPKLEISLISGWNVSQSSVDSKDYKTIEKSLMRKIVDRKERRQKSLNKNLAIPYLFPAGTDSTWFRNPFSAGVTGVEPIPSYGFFPIFITVEDVASMHGSNEKFPVKEITPTIERYFFVLRELAHDDGKKLIDRIFKR